MERKALSNNNKKQQNHDNPHMQNSAAVFNSTFQLKFFCILKVKCVNITLTSVQL